MVKVISKSDKKISATSALQEPVHEISRFKIRDKKEKNMKLPKYYAPLLPGPPPPLCQKAVQRMSRQKRRKKNSADKKETIEN